MQFDLTIVLERLQEMLSTYYAQLPNRIADAPRARAKTGSDR